MEALYCADGRCFLVATLDKFDVRRPLKRVGQPCGNVARIAVDSLDAIHSETPANCIGDEVRTIDIPFQRLGRHGLPLGGVCSLPLSFRSLNFRSLFGELNRNHDQHCHLDQKLSVICGSRTLIDRRH